MKKLTAFILACVILLSVQISAFAENFENYEYILPMEYNSISRLNNGYLAYDKQEKVALYDLNGKKISDDYDYISTFYKDDVTYAKKDGKYYVINSFGEVLSEYDKRIFDVSELVFVNLTEENEDGRPLSYFEGEFGVYNYWGELLTVLPYEKYMPPKNSSMGLTFAGGRLMYKENDKWGALNLSFQTAIEPVYDAIYPFYENQGGITIARKDIKYGLIDAQGNEITDFLYDSLNFLHDDNGNITGYTAANGDKYTVFDKHGNIILKDIENFVPWKFYEKYNLIEVYIDNPRSEIDGYAYLYGLTDTDGNVVIPAENIYTYAISDGIIPVEKSEGHWGYYDIKGNAITDFKYTLVSLFSEGFGYVQTKSGDEWIKEVIDKNGNVVENPPVWNDNGFFGGIAKNGNGEIINKKGEVVMKNDAWKQISWLDWWSYNDDGCFKVSNENENCGVVRYKGYISPWAEKEIEKAMNLGIAKSDKNYDYIKNITREEFCELIYNYYTLNPDGPTAVYTKNPFTDTDNSHIAFLNATGIVKGKSENLFAPDDLLTREEAATIIFRLIQNLYPDSEVTQLYFEFDDNADISDWAENNIQAICNMGIMKGIEGNKFAPKQNFTTEQAIATMVRTYENFK